MLENTDESEIALITFETGYHNSDLLAAPANSLALGSKNLFVTDSNSLRVFRGMKPKILIGGRTMFVVANGFAALVDVGATHGVGSIFNYISESLFWIGEGKVNFNGAILNDTVTLTDFTATSSLQLSPKVGSSYQRAYTAGLAQPDAVTVVSKTPAPASAFTGLLTGLYSFKIARIRSTTGGRSIASPTSAAVLFDHQTARLTFPSADSNGQDRWAIFATKAGFGGVGVHYLVEEIAESDLTTIDSIARSYELEFNDSDLLPITAYIDDYPPPAGAFAARLENYVVVIGCYDNAIAISIRNFPESFNPDHLAFLPKSPTAVLQDMQNEYIYISTESGVYALSVAPAAFDNPMMVQTVWSDTGVAHAHNWCSYEGVIFAFVSRQGAVTMDSVGKPSSAFALPVAREMRDWSIEETFVFTVPDLKSVIYTNNGKCYAFNTQNLKWSSPAYVSDFENGTIISGVVQNRRLWMTMLQTGVFNLFEFDEQNGTTPCAWIAKSPAVETNSAGRAHILGLRAKFYASQSGNTDVKIFCDNAASADKTLTHTSGSAGMQTSIRTRWYLPRKEALAVSIEGSQSVFTEYSYPSRVVVFGAEDNSVKY